jgi:hypothetical protein
MSAHKFNRPQKATQQATQTIETPIGRIYVEAVAPDKAPDKLLDEYLTEDELAEQIGRTLRTIRRWRALGEGPPWCRVGRQTFYRKQTVRAWFAGLEQDT